MFVLSTQMKYIKNLLCPSHIFKMSTAGLRFFLCIMMKIFEFYICIKFATGYVEEIYQTILKMLQTPSELADALTEIEDMKPEHMNTILDKQSRAVAIEKHIARNAILPVDVPPTKGTNSFLKNFCS